MIRAGFKPMPDLAAAAQYPPAHEPARALAVGDPAAETWRTIARVVAWIALVIVSAQLLAILCNLLYDPRSIFGAIFDTRDALRRGSAPNLLMGVQQFWYLLLTATLLVGAVATLLRRRWGPSVLLAYALGTIPSALLSVIWLIVQNASLRQRYPQMNQRPLVLELLMYAVSTVGQLAFPAVLFAIMSRPAIRRQFAHLGPRSAFEPLSVTPAPGPAQP
jgi:hypothetical protein